MMSVFIDFYMLCDALKLITLAGLIVYIYDD